jgi:hypothetical protein
MGRSLKIFSQCPVPHPTSNILLTTAELASDVTNPGFPETIGGDIARQIG